MNRIELNDATINIDNLTITKWNSLKLCNYYGFYNLKLYTNSDGLFSNLATLRKNICPDINNLVKLSNNFYTSIISNNIITEKHINDCINGITKDALLNKYKRIEQSYGTKCINKTGNCAETNRHNERINYILNYIWNIIYYNYKSKLNTNKLITISTNNSIKYIVQMEQFFNATNNYHLIYSNDNNSTVYYDSSCLCVSHFCVPFEITTNMLNRINNEFNITGKFETIFRLNDNICYTTYVQLLNYVCSNVKDTKLCIKDICKRLDTYVLNIYKSIDLNYITKENKRIINIQEDSYIGKIITLFKFIEISLIDNSNNKSVYNSLVLDYVQNKYVDRLNTSSDIINSVAHFIMPVMYKDNVNTSILESLFLQSNDNIPTLFKNYITIVDLYNYCRARNNVLSDKQLYEEIIRVITKIKPNGGMYSYTTTKIVPAQQINLVTNNCCILINNHINNEELDIQLKTLNFFAKTNGYTNIIINKSNAPITTAYIKNLCINKKVKAIYIWNDVLLSNEVKNEINDNNCKLFNLTEYANNKKVEA